MDILRHRLQNLHEITLRQTPRGMHSVLSSVISTLEEEIKEASFLGYLRYVGSVQCMLLSSLPAPTPVMLSRVLSHTEGALLCMSPLLHASLFHKFC